MEARLHAQLRARLLAPKLARCQPETILLAWNTHSILSLTVPNCVRQLVHMLIQGSLFLATIDTRHKFSVEGGFVKL